MATRTSSSNYGGKGGGKENNGAKDIGHAGSNGKDGVFDIDSVAFSSDDFRMNEFKVKRCPRARPHDWTQCPFAHPGEKARRRDPRRYKYSGTACPEFRKSGCCRRGDACPFAHGVFECWLHPSRYRTQLCTDGTNCKRRVCFFAHVEEELRHPDDDPGVAQKQVQAELAVEVQTLQQQHLTQALQALLLQTTTNPLAAPVERQPVQLPVAIPEMMKPSAEMISAAMVPVHGVDNSNPTAALQLVLMQQLAAKEQQLQQALAEKSGDMPTVSSVAEPTMIPISSYLPQPQKQPDVYDALSQLKQLSLAATAPVTTAPPSAAPSFDAAALLSQMLPNGGGGTNISVPDLSSQNPILLQSLLAQTAAKDAAVSNGHTRRSIDNSYLPSLVPDATGGQIFGSMGFPATAFPNGGYSAASGTNGITTEPAGGAQSPIAAANGVYPNVSSPTETQYSVENIQRLLQDPAFSSNLSQLLQMNPALLQQLAPNTASEAGNPSRRSIDNAYLSTRPNGTMHRFVTNGGIHGVASPENEGNNHTTAPTSNGDAKILNGAIASEALLLELNALKFQLGNAQGNGLYEAVTSVGQDGYNFPPHSSSVDSERPTSSGISTSSQQQDSTDDQS